MNTVKLGAGLGKFSMSPVLSHQSAFASVPKEQGSFAVSDHPLLHLSFML